MKGKQWAQVKKKMTLEEFIRNNRGINSGENLPQEFLQSLYVSICRNEIKISSEAAAGQGLNALLWTQLSQQSVSPRGAILDMGSLGAITLYMLQCGCLVLHLLDSNKNPL